MQCVQKDCLFCRHTLLIFWVSRKIEASTIWNMMQFNQIQTSCFFGAMKHVHSLVCWNSFTYQYHCFDFGPELSAPCSGGGESVWFILKVIVVNLGGVGFKEAGKASDGDSCDSCLDLLPSALVHRQCFCLTSNRLQLQMFPVIFMECLCMHVCNCILTVDVTVCIYKYILSSSHFLCCQTKWNHVRKQKVLDKGNMSWD